ncbi:hypothetical protein FA15DRAFT_711424 [Coprinopsis marcescibilis]|uniref:Uncharacterized protein n=1 Tax=Coprinopsis marcescibilis TaxID=230819 RepID=A0A5C3K9P4_COPMA|nr:hypothetical protein FA15DRAFT_711424 [Coprinopsis marcescibilis]
MGANVFYPTNSAVSILQADAPALEDVRSQDTENASQLSNGSDGKDDQEMPAQPIFRKREHKPAAPTPASKCPRTSYAASALQDMANSVLQFGQAVAAAFAPAPNAVNPTPCLCMNAIQAVQKNKPWMDLDQLIQAIDLFHCDKTACKAYLLFTDNPELQRQWLTVQLL